jgi:hypothetical protein
MNNKTISVDFKADNYSIHFDLRSYTLEDDMPGAHKYFLYSLMVSSIVLAQIGGSIWLLQKVGDSETVSKSVYYSYLDKSIHTWTEHNLEFLWMPLSFFLNCSI